MFEFMEVTNQDKAREILQDNPWLSKFLKEYLKNDSDILDETVVRSGLKIPKDIQLVDGVKDFVVRTKKFHDLPDDSQESFQNLLYVIGRLKSNLKKQHEVLAPLFLSLHVNDLSQCVDFLTNKAEIPESFIKALEEV